MSVHLVVTDLETTGLDKETDPVLEIGAIAVDKELNEVARFHAVIHYCLLDIDVPGVVVQIPGYPGEYVVNMHKKNGLWDACQQSRLPEAKADFLFSSWLSSMGTKNIKMAGNSIHFDLGYIQRRLPLSARYFGYRIRDFGALMDAMEDAGLPVARTPKDQFKHRSISDCELELADGRVAHALFKRCALMLRAEDAVAAQ